GVGDVLSVTWLQRWERIGSSSRHAGERHTIPYPVCQKSIGEQTSAYRYSQMVQSDQGLWIHSASGRRQGRLCSHLGGRARWPQQSHGGAGARIRTRLEQG